MHPRGLGSLLFHPNVRCSKTVLLREGATRLVLVLALTFLLQNSHVGEESALPENCLYEEEGKKEKGSLETDHLPDRGGCVSASVRKGTGTCSWGQVGNVRLPSLPAADWVC